MGIVGSYLDLEVSAVEEFIIDSDEVRKIQPNIFKSTYRKTGA